MFRRPTLLILVCIHIANMNGSQIPNKRVFGDVQSGASGRGLTQEELDLRSHSEGPAKRYKHFESHDELELTPEEAAFIFQRNATPNNDDIALTKAKPEIIVIDDEPLRQQSENYQKNLTPHSSKPLETITIESEPLTQEKVAHFVGFVASAPHNKKRILPQLSPPTPIELPEIKYEKALFSFKDSIKQELLQLIRNEKKSIHLAMYTFTDADIAQALIDAKNRGVLIEIILDSNLSGQFFCYVPNKLRIY